MNTRSEWYEGSTTGMDNMFYTKEETIANVQTNFDYRRFYSTEGYTVSIDGIEVQVIIQDHTNPINESDVDKKILIPMDTVIHTGSYVVFRDTTWIINSNVNIVDDAYKICQMQLCNYVINFQHPTTGTILSYPCIIESKSSLGIDENNTITTVNAQCTIKLPFDDNTKLIGINKRFFIDKYGNTVAKVTNVNNTEFNYGDKGLIVLTLQQDSSYNPATDKNGVCNYSEPTVEPEPTPSPSGYTLTIASSGDFNLGITRTLTPTLKDDLGNVVTDWIAVWSVNYNGMTQSYFTITYVENQCKVAILEDAYDIIDGVLELTCTVSGDTTSGVYSGIVSA